MRKRQDSKQFPVSSFPEKNIPYRKHLCFFFSSCDPIFPFLCGTTSEGDVCNNDNTVSPSSFPLSPPFSYQFPHTHTHAHTPRFGTSVFPAHSKWELRGRGDVSTQQEETQMHLVGMKVGKVMLTRDQHSSYYANEREKKSCLFLFETV